MQKGKNFDIKVRRMTRLKKRSNFMTNVYSFINKEKSQKVFSGMAIVAMLVLTVGVVPAVSSASVVNPGSIVVCKVVEDSNGNVIAGNAGSTFTIPFVNANYEGPATGVPSAAVFTTPLTLQTVFGDVQGQCVTKTNLAYGRYYYDEEQVSSSDAWETPLYNDQANMTVTDLSQLGNFNTNLDTQFDNFDGVINISSDTPSRTLIVLNKMQAVEQSGPTFNFYKEICPSYSDITGNNSADKVDATGGHFTDFTNYNASDSALGFGNDTTLPVDPSEVPEACKGAAGWSFLLSSDQAQTADTQTVGTTDSNGELQVPFSSLNSALQNVLTSGGNLWISEVAQNDVATFGALRCYTDAMNGDNLEFVSFGGDQVQSFNCIAYNVAPAQQPTTGTIVVVKKTVGGDGKFSFSMTGQDNFDITTTAGTGSQEFDNLTPGDYTVSELAGLPAGWTFNGSDCVYENQSVGQQVEGGELVTLDAGDTVTCTFTNTFSQGGGDGGGDSVTDPSITKTVDDNTPVVGQVITYTLTVTENSSLNDTNVVVSDPLPADVTYQSNDLPAQAIFDAGTDTVTWTIPAINAGQSVILHIVGKIHTGASGSLVNTASITSGADQGDSDTSNDSATSTVTVGSNSGCSENCGGGGGGGGVILTPTPPPTPTPTPTPSGEGGAGPQGQVLGASTSLPRTGNSPIYLLLLILVALTPLAYKKFKRA